MELTRVEKQEIVLKGQIELLEDIKKEVDKKIKDPITHYEVSEILIQNLKSLEAQLKNLWNTKELFN